MNCFWSKQQQRFQDLFTWTDCFLFSAQPLWILWQQRKCCRNEEPGGELPTNVSISNLSNHTSMVNCTTSTSHGNKSSFLLQALCQVVDICLSSYFEIICPSLLSKVLQERYVWAEDAGRSWGRVCVHSLWSEARSLALQLHSVRELHREVAHIKKPTYLTTECERC